MRALWSRFADEYTSGSNAAHNAQNLAWLDALAFGEGPAAFMAMRTVNPDLYECAKRGLEHAAAARSEKGAGEELRPLSHAVVEALVAQWVGLRARNHLAPEHEGPDVRCSRSLYPQRTERRRELLRTPEASLLAGAIRMAESNLIGAQIHRAATILRGRVPVDTIRESAEALFDSSLFTYRPDRNVLFTTFLGGGFKRILVPNSSRDYARNRTSSPITVPHDHPVLVNEQDHAPAPEETFQSKDEAVALRSVLATLPQNEREVLRPGMVSMMGCSVRLTTWPKGSACRLSASSRSKGRR